MTERVFIPQTDRRGMTKARATRIFLACDGKCAICGERIRDGEAYDVEHPDPLWAGGSDKDADLVVVHTRCHKGKTAREAAERSKRNRIITASWAGKPKSKLSKEYRQQVLSKIKQRQEAQE